MATIDPSQTTVPAPVSTQLPQVQPVSVGRPTGNEKEPVPPPSVEPGELFFFNE